MYSRVIIAAERCCAGRCLMTAGQGYRVCTCFRAQSHERDLHITEALAKAALTALKSGVVASPTHSPHRYVIFHSFIAYSWTPLSVTISCSSEVILFLSNVLSPCS